MGTLRTGRTDGRSVRTGPQARVPPANRPLREHDAREGTADGARGDRVDDAGEHQPAEDERADAGVADQQQADRGEEEVADRDRRASGGTRPRGGRTGGPGGHAAGREQQDDGDQIEVADVGHPDHVVVAAGGGRADEVRVVEQPARLLPGGGQVGAGGPQRHEAAGRRLDGADARERAEVAEQERQRAEDRAADERRRGDRWVRGRHFLPHISLVRR